MFVRYTVCAIWARKNTLKTHLAFREKLHIDVGQIAVYTQIKQIIKIPTSRYDMLYGICAVLTLYIPTSRYGMLSRICAVQILPGLHVLQQKIMQIVTASTRQHELF